MNKEGVGIRHNQQAVGRIDRSVVNTYQQNNSRLTLAQMLFMQLSGEVYLTQALTLKLHRFSELNFGVKYKRLLQVITE